MLLRVIYDQRWSLAKAIWQAAAGHYVQNKDIFSQEKKTHSMKNWIKNDEEIVKERLST